MNSALQFKGPELEVFVPFRQEMMMRIFLKWASRGLFALAIAGSMMMAGPMGATAVDCPDPKPNPYMCPPLTASTCNTACKNIGFIDGGDCVGSGCCTCWF